MATVSVSVSGDGYYVTADTYEALITPLGITELYLTDSDSPTTDIANVFRFASCSVDGTFRALNDAGVVSLEEDTSARAIVQVTGELQQIGGGASMGTATFRVACYPDRMVVDVAITITGGTTVTWIAPFWLYTLSGQTDADYDYATTAGGAWTTFDPPGTWGARASAAGPFSFMTSHNNYALITSTYLVGGWSGTTYLRDLDNGTDFSLLLRDTGCAKDTTYYAAVQIEPSPFITGTRPAQGGQSRTQAFLDPDNLDDTADDGEVVTGTLKTDVTYDHDTDGFIEGEGAYAVTADGNEVKVKFDRTNTGTANDFFCPAIECYGVAGSLVFAKKSTNGTDWSTLVSGTDFNIQTSGANRVFQVFDDFDVTANPMYFHLLWEESAGGDGLTHGHALDAPGVTQLHVATPADSLHGHTLDVTGVYELVTGTPTDSLHGHTLDDAVAVAYPTGSPDGLAHSHTLDAVTVSQIHIETPDGLTHGHTLDSTAGWLEVALYLSLAPDGTRRLSWLASGTVSVAVDGQYIATTEESFLNCSSTYAVRGVLVAYSGAGPPTLATPLDVVRVIVVTGDSILHHVERQPDAGAWARITTLGPGSVTYDDGPLDDGLYHYRLVAEDDQGTTATSATKDATVSSVPDPPTGLSYAWDAPTKTLTLSWAASASADVVAYRVREGNPSIELDAAADWEGAATTWDRLFTTETGVYTWLVRAVDADGNEEQNITAAITVAFQGAALAGHPAEPRIVTVEAVAAGKIEVGWLYDPRYEDPSFGNVGFEARIYGDNATGTVSFAAPLATVAMGVPDYAERFSWTSGVLVNDSAYKFVVRIGSAAHPNGFETDNIDEHTATANTNVPATPTLSVEIV